MKNLEIKNYLCLNSRYKNDEIIINIGLSYIINGLDVIQKINASYPKAKIMMDIKIFDNDYLNAKIAFDTDVDMVSVLGNASNNTIVKVLRIAEANHKDVIVDIRNMKDQQQSIEDLNILGVKYVLVDKEMSLPKDMVACLNVDNVEQFLRLQMIAQELVI